MGMFDGIVDSAKSISGSALGVDGALRNILGPAYSQINIALGQIMGADGVMRQSDMQKVIDAMQGISQQGGNSGVSAAKQARILMMIVEINALKVQLQKLEEDLEEVKRDVADPELGNAQRVRRDINSIPSGNADDARAAKRLLEQQNDLAQMLSKLLQQTQDASKSVINNLGR